MFHLGSVRFSPAWDFRVSFGLLSCKKLSEENELRNGVMRDPMSLVSKESVELVALLKSRGCLGCFSKPPVIISMGEESKGLRTQGQTMDKDNRSEDFWWSSSFIEMDQSATQSQRSISSIAVSNHPSDPQSSAGIQIDPPEFVNQGLILWKQVRQQWVRNRRSEHQTQVGEPRIGWNATYESLLGTSKPLPQPIPLGEMVDFLVDIWELEGLYD